jgi:hypothetical protein
MAEEIALFIDFENIRYSLLNTQHREPDPQELINVARRYGTVMVAKAYADWSRQPEMFKGSLTAAMIDRVDCPAKQRDRYRSGWQPTPTNGTNGGTNGWNGNGARDSASESWNGTSAILSVNGQHEDEQSEEPATTTSRFADTQEALPAIGAPSTGQTQYGSQSTVDLNMLMDIIETVFDRPSISHFVLMTGDRDFTRICARLKLRLNKFVVVAGVPGTVSRDLTAAANQFVLLGNHTTFGPMQSHGSTPLYVPQSAMEPTDPQFLQFLDYIDRHWAWRTVIGVANFIGDPYNHKNRFRGRLTRESARDLLQACIQQGILSLQTDMAGNEDLHLNRANPVVDAALASAAQQQQPQGSYGQQPITTQAQGPYSQMGPWTSTNYAQTSTSSFVRRIVSATEEEEDVETDGEDEELQDIEEDMAED